MAYLNIPELTSTQKQQMKGLMDNYFNAAADQVFAYRSDTRRESYASTKKIASTADAMGGCMNTAGKYLMNYGVFAQMIWMGRKIEDFTSHLSTPTTSISKAFDSVSYTHLDVYKRQLSECPRRCRACMRS